MVFVSGVAKGVKDNGLFRLCGGVQETLPGPVTKRGALPPRQIVVSLDISMV